MRIVSLAAATGLAALALGPRTATAQERPGIDPALSKEIRRIVREEVRAALRELRSADAPAPKKEKEAAREAERARPTELRWIELERSSEAPESIQEEILELAKGARGKAVRIELPERTDGVDVEHIRKVLEQSLEPKLQDAERRIEVLVKRLDEETGDLDVHVDRAIEKALRSVDLEKLEADLKPVIENAEGHVQVIVKRLDGVDTDVSGALEAALKHLKDADVHIQGLEKLRDLKIEGLQVEPKEIRVEVHAERGDAEEEGGHVDGARHRVLVVPEGGAATPFHVEVQRSDGAESAPQILHLHKADAGAQPKKTGADGGGCQAGCCEPGCCAEPSKGGDASPLRIVVQKADGGESAPQILHVRKVDAGAQPKKTKADSGCCPSGCCESGCCAERPKGRIMV